MTYCSDSIKSMECFVFNTESGKYESVPVFITGKSPQKIAAEYGVSHIRVRQYALKRKLPYYGTINKVKEYVFDAVAEEAFKNRPRESSGRPSIPKQPKTPGKPGRPRKEKPDNATTKMPVGRPRKPQSTHL